MDDRDNVNLGPEDAPEHIWARSYLETRLGWSVNGLIAL